MDSIIFNLDDNDGLYQAILDNYTNEYNGVMDGLIYGKINLQKFSDGELCVDYQTSVRGKRVYLLCSPNTSDKILQLNFAIDAAKRAAAKEIIPIIPFFPYARQDKKDQLRGPIGAKVLAEMLENRGATQIITFDLHSDQVQGFFNIPVTHMEGKYLFDRYLYDSYYAFDGNITLCAPDSGAAKRVKEFRDQLRSRWGIDIPIVMIDKTRPKANEISEMVLIGSVEGRNVIIIDDMCDTGRTLVKATEELLEMGAKSVRAVVTHGVLSGDAYNRISKSKLKEFVCSNSLPIKEVVYITKTSDYITKISIHKQILKAIIAINNDTSVEILKNEL